MWGDSVSCSKIKKTIVFKASVFVYHLKSLFTILFQYYIKAFEVYRDNFDLYALV